MVAGVVGMVPEGLVLLTSLAFGVAAVTLARRKVLVQELPAVEGLARVDVVCLDKTGTLTEGDVVFDRLELLDRRASGDPRGRRRRGARRARRRREPQRDARARSARPSRPPGWARDRRGAVLVGPQVERATLRRARHVGDRRARDDARAPTPDDPVRAPRRRARRGGPAGAAPRARRRALDGESAARGPGRPAALVLLEERIRPGRGRHACGTSRDQGVALKVISGDNPRTVGGGGAARRAAPAPTPPIDARELPEDTDELADVLEEPPVFGRVTPQQKRAMVGALQSRGHVVAMTGDGVNDALALKDADIGVAMGSGAAATRAVAQLVLLDGKFATMPGVVAEGRRVIANIERSANLFVTKTVYAILLAVVVVLAGWPYPFLPAAPHDREHVHDRHPRLLPRARARTSAATSRASSSGCCGSACPPGIVACVAVAARRTGSRTTSDDLSLREARTSRDARARRGRALGPRAASPARSTGGDPARRRDGRLDRGDPRWCRALRDFYALEAPVRLGARRDGRCICVLSAVAIEIVLRSHRAGRSSGDSPEYAEAAAHVA